MPLSLALEREKIEEIIIHTGQHYDYEMSKIFFETMELKSPKYHLGIGSLSHGAQTGRMMEEIEKILFDEKPEGIVVYGDTNSTLAGAISSVKLKIPVFHIEAGLRSFNRNMPEEINRVLTDHISTLLFAPTKTSVSNLKKEGIKENIFLVGDIMFDTFLIFKDKFKKRSKEILKKFNLRPSKYGVVTIHREENTDDKKRFYSILKGLKEIADKGLRLIFPAHPRIIEFVPKDIDGIEIIKPLSYIDMQSLVSRAKIVLTDSGGLQKEAYFHKVPCITLREETEWVELKRSGTNIITGWKSEEIIKSFKRIERISKIYFEAKLYGNGDCGQRTANIIKSYLGER